MWFFKNNLFNSEFENVSSNGAINFGNAIVKGMSSGEKAVGGQAVTGDFSPSKNLNWNINKDPDAVDQPQSQV